MRKITEEERVKLIGTKIIDLERLKDLNIDGIKDEIQEICIYVEDEEGRAFTYEICGNNLSDVLNTGSTDKERLEDLFDRVYMLEDNVDNINDKLDKLIQALKI